MIYEKRIEAGITQAKLAEQLGIERSTVAKWETGKASPRAGKLLEISRILNCNVEELLMEERSV